MFKGVTLKGLEVFEALARSGSVAGAAEATGLSQPAVSQQMRNLEAALGVPLVDHARRPMQLTSAGRTFLARTHAVLTQLRQAQNDLTVVDLAHLSDLSLGVIDDFDNDLTPRLVTILAESMAGCRFRLVTAPSLDITAALQDGRLQMAVAASSGEVVDGLVELPLVRDPFLVLLPAGSLAAHGSVEAAMQALPFLRYERTQLIGRQIEAILAREGQSFAERFEIGAHLSLVTLVARGVGWAMTTPLGYMRAERLHGEIDAVELPFRAASRTISMFANADLADGVPRDLARTIGKLVDELAIAPAVQRLPWLEGQLRLLAE